MVRGLAPTDRDPKSTHYLAEHLQDMLVSIGVSPCLDFPNRKIDEMEPGAPNNVVMLNMNR